MKYAVIVEQAGDNYAAHAPGSMRVGLSTRFPFTGFRAKLHPEIATALHQALTATQR